MNTKCEDCKNVSTVTADEVEKYGVPEGTIYCSEWGIKLHTKEGQVLKAKICLADENPDELITFPTGTR